MIWAPTKQSFQGLLCFPLIGKIQQVLKCKHSGFQLDLCGLQFFFEHLLSCTREHPESQVLSRIAHTSKWTFPNSGVRVSVQQGNKNSQASTTFLGQDWKDRDLPSKIDPNREPGIFRGVTQITHADVCSKLPVRDMQVKELWQTWMPHHGKSNVRLSDHVSSSCVCLLKAFIPVS